jgi:hypothetical protein
MPNASRSRYRNESETVKLERKSKEISSYIAARQLQEITNRILFIDELN